MQRDSTRAQDVRERIAFQIYLRTRRIIPAEEIEGLQFKFNPWHDTRDGRFTFAGHGTYHSDLGDSGRHGRSVGPPDPSARRPDTFSPGGGSFGGGASGSWSEPATSEKRETRRPAIRSDSRIAATQLVTSAVTRARPLPEPKLPAQRIEKNGYSFEISSKTDSDRRTKRVSGTLHLAETSRRSRSAQSRAGGTDRKPTDDGGHFIAARFNGPREWYNHFAQDSNFNRGTYRVVEDGWAKDIKAGQNVKVEIVPHYSGRSTRPDSLTIIWDVDGHERIKKIPNARTEKKGTGVTRDKYDLLGPIYATIGHECSSIVGGNVDGLYLYADAGDGYSGGAIFIDEGDLIRYYRPTSKLCELILDAWEIDGPNEKWAIMEYEIKDGGFDANLVYPDEIDADLSDIDLRKVFLKRRFGDKPVVYPSWDDEMSDLTLDADGQVIFADEPRSVIVPPTRDASGTLRFPTKPVMHLPRKSLNLTRDASGRIRFPKTPES